jgi:hypothetical protein
MFHVQQSSLAYRLFRSRHEWRSERASSLAYFALVTNNGAKQRVPVTWIYPEKQRVTMPDRILSLRALVKKYHDAGARYKVFWMRQRLRRNTRVGWWDFRTPTHPKQLPAHSSLHRSHTPRIHQGSTLRTYVNRKSMMRLCRNHVCYQFSLQIRPLNLNPDGSTITYKKVPLWSECHELGTRWCWRNHAWRHPGREKPTYVNPVCSEKLKDDYRASEHYSASRSALRAPFSLAQACEHQSCSTMIWLYRSRSG